ncbi:MAG: SGNH/GDSL hydrolase family protein, partial [Candidatus Cryptobacteroides sp.]
YIYHNMRYAIFMRRNILVFVTALLLAAPFALYGQGRRIDPLKDGAEIHGTGWTELRGGYVRLPEYAKGKVREDVWNLGRNSSGLSVVFRSNTSRLEVRCVLEDRMQMFHMPATGVSGVDLFAYDSRGEEHWCAPKFRPSFSQGKGTEVFYNYERLDYERETDIYTYRLYLPLYNTVKNLELTVDEDCAFEFLPVEDAAPVVIYGTSIAQGACASRPGMAWTSIVGRRLDCPVVNLGFSGNGRMELEMFALLNEIDAAAYVIDCLPNINVGDDFESRLEEGISLLRANHSCPILLVEHSGYANDFTNHGRLYANQLNDRQEALYKRLRKKVGNLYYLTREEIGWDNDSMVEGVHPNDYGMTLQAQAVTRILRKVIPVRK